MAKVLKDLKRFNKIKRILEIHRVAVETVLRKES